MEKGDFFVVVIDKERSELLEAMMGILVEEENSANLLASLRRRGIPFASFLGLVKELGDNVHERGWCTDEGCDYQE